MFQFLLIFIFLFCILVLLSPEHRVTLSGRKDWLAYAICFSLLFFLAAFRAPMVGNDTGEYIRIYNSSDEMISSGSRYEIGYLFFNHILHYISDDARLLLVVSSLIIFSVYGFVIHKYSYRPKLALLLYFLLLFGTSINTIRQSLAICILLLNLDNIVNKHLLRFLLFTIIAALFHTTAILFVIIYPISYIKLKIKTILLTFIISVIGIYLFSDIMNLALTYFEMYESYTEGMYFEGGTRIASTVRVGFSLIFFLFSYFLYNRFSDIQWRNSVEGKRYSLFLLMELLALMINFFSLKVNLLDRLGLYFTAITPVLISNAICLLPVKMRRIVTISFLLILIIYNCIVINYRPDWNRVFPIELSIET